MKNLIQKFVRQLVVVTAGAACVASTLTPLPAAAAPNAGVTQLKYLQTLAQLTGDAGLFAAGSKPEDYAAWARTRNVDPTGGWKPSAKLSSDILAQSLVQLYGLNPRKYGGDYYRILEREGIVIDRSATVTGETLAGLVDNPVVALKSLQVAGSPTSPNKPGNGNG